MQPISIAMAEGTSSLTASQSWQSPTPPLFDSVADISWTRLSFWPDCNKNHALNAIVGAAFGAAGQRCMALSTLVMVDGTKEWLPELAERAKKLKVNGGFEEGADLGPVISPQSRKRIEDLIASAEKEGATILLDGRGYKPEKYPNGNWVGTN